jgi:hypothetical protein
MQSVQKSKCAIQTNLSRGPSRLQDAHHDLTTFVGITSDYAIDPITGGQVSKLETYPTRGRIGVPRYI